MGRKEIQEEITKLINLLYREKQEDLKQYQAKIKNTSFAERRKSGICWYPVKIEKSTYSSTERLMVRVSRPREHNESHMFQSGKLVSLFSNAYDNQEDSESVNGVVNRALENEMIITLNTDDHPDWIYDGKLGVQLLFDENSYREMEAGLKKLLTSEDERIEELKQILLGNKEATFVDNYTMNLPELNPSQNLALNKVLSAKDIAIIHGPPGTGKTTTLVQSIVQVLKKETQVLVCAPSNTAVDLIVEKLGTEGIDVVRIGHPARVNDEVMNQTLDSKIAKHSQYKELKTLKKSAEEYRNLGHKYKRNFGPEEREQRRLLLSEAKRFKTEANLLSDYIKNDILDKTRVIATTLVGANNDALRGKKFSTVFIDEAAQGLEPATWLPILKSEKVVFAGDHCQLPPTIKSFAVAKEGLEVTLFEKAIQRNAADIMLQEQYRMNNKIMEFSNKQFYNGKLKANKEVDNWTIFPEDLPIEFVDTAGCGFYEQSNPESKSAYNTEEADLLFKHLNNYLESIKVLGLSDTVGSLGIISPYKAQVKHMQEAFDDKVPDDILPKGKIAVNTIDSFQGQERDVIYISLVRSNDKGEIGFLKDTRRMNVAMTRAKKKLVIIGDSGTICSHPFYNSFVDYINEIGAYRSAYELMY